MPDHRQLAVIMFADIVGYTALMQHNEEEALGLLQRFKEELQARIKESQGEIIQFYGDGCLAVFTSAADAVGSAKILQEKFRESPRVPVRIGIHLGDVLFKEGNIFGDCVNITSRIESMGVPGTVLLSDVVNKQIKNKPEFRLTSLGEFEFKNVDEPMEIFALTNKGFPTPGAASETGKFKEEHTGKSIAVLPFVNMSNDPDQEYFSDGMAEEILNSLTHLKGLKVAGRISSFQFKGKNASLNEIGEKLGVQSVLEGSVRKQGNRLRITAQLINVKDGYQLWSEKYDREMIDIFSIQEEIALAITEALKLRLMKKDRELITKVATRNTQAYELFLKGRFFAIRRGASILTAIRYFQQAIELDPDFALAHSGYADANLLLSTYGLLPPKQAMIRAKESAERAIELDPSLCEPYCSLAYYYACYEWNWPEAKKNFLTSIGLNPRYAEVHLRYGCNYLTWVEGKFEEGEEHGKIAIKVEPLHSVCYGTHSLILHTAGKFNEALEVCKMGIEVDGNSFICRINEGSIYLALEQYENAITSYEIAAKMFNRHHFTINGLIWSLCLAGEPDKARVLMDELKERYKKEYIASTFTAISASYLGDLDEAFNLLEKAYQDREPILLTLKYWKWGTPAFRNDPRFQKLLDKIGFPEPTGLAGIQKMYR